MLLLLLLIFLCVYIFSLYFLCYSSEWLQKPQALNSSRKRNVNLWCWNRRRCRILIKKIVEQIQFILIRWYCFSIQLSGPSGRKEKKMTNECEVTIMWLVTNYDAQSMNNILNYSHWLQINSKESISTMGRIRTYCYSKLSFTSIIYITSILLINSIQCISGK